MTTETETEAAQAGMDAGVSSMRLAMLAMGMPQPQIDEITEKAKDFHSLSRSKITLYVSALAHVIGQKAGTN